MAISAIFQGAIVGASMIIPIGAQNSYILTQGIRRNHHLLVASICFFCDIVLTIAGVFGGSKIIASNDFLLTIIGCLGILFLLSYAAQSLYRAYKMGYEHNDRVSSSMARKTVIATTFAVTLLNPHVYLDTVVILGSIGSTYIQFDKIYFTFGAILAAGLWFYGLALGAEKLAAVLSKPKVLRGVDILVGTVMCLVAFNLYFSFFTK